MVLEGTILTRYRQSIGWSAKKLMPLFVAGLTFVCGWSLLRPFVCLFEGQLKKHISLVVLFVQMTNCILAQLRAVDGWVIRGQKW